MGIIVLIGFLISFFIKKIDLRSNVIIFYILIIFLSFLFILTISFDFKSLSIPKISSNNILAIPNDLGNFPFPSYFIFNSFNLDFFIFLPFKFLSVLFFPIIDFSLKSLFIFFDYFLFFLIIYSIFIRYKVLNQSNYFYTILIIGFLIIFRLTIFVFNYANIMRHKLLVFYFLFIILFSDKKKIK